jgi:hypothetical protein
MPSTDGMDVQFIETGTSRPIERYSGEHYDPDMTAEDFADVMDEHMRLLVEGGTLPSMTWHIVVWPDGEFPMVKIAIDSVDAYLLNGDGSHIVEWTGEPSLWNKRFDVLTDLIELTGRSYLAFESHPASENWANMNFGFVVVPGDLLCQQYREYGRTG